MILLTSGSDLFRAPLRVGLPGSEAFSLISDMLVLGRRTFPLLDPLLLCLNFTSFPGRVMMSLGVGKFAEEEKRGRLRRAGDPESREMKCTFRG